MVGASRDHNSRFLLSQGDESFLYGRIKGQNIKVKGTMFELLLSLYADNESFLFELWSDMEKEASMLHHHRKCFRLLMNIRRDGGNL
jgi:hypothetical protein